MWEDVLSELRTPCSVEDFLKGISTVGMVESRRSCGDMTIYSVSDEEVL